MADNTQQLIKFYEDQIIFSNGQLTEVNDGITEIDEQIQECNDVKDKIEKMDCDEKDKWNGKKYNEFICDYEGSIVNIKINVSELNQLKGDLNVRKSNINRIISNAQSMLDKHNK